MFESEKNLLKLIRYVPVFVIILFSLVATYFAIEESNDSYNKKLHSITQEMTQNSKNRIKEEVLRVYGSIIYEKSTTNDKLKASIKQRVHEAHVILTNIYEKNKLKPKDEIVQMMKNALNDIRFNNGRGYYFIYKMDGENIMLPPNSKLEGKSFWNFKDAKGVYTIRGMSNLVKEKGEGFYTWYWYKPGDNKKQYKKIGFGKYFEPFDWFIGTGEYINDFENDIKKTIVEKINHIKYGKNGYIFLFDYDGINLSHIKKEYRGKNRIDLKDPNGFMIVEELIKVAKNGEGFIQYLGTIKPSTGEPALKTSFIKGIDEWQWAIGSGLYLDELNSEILSRVDEIQNAQNSAIKRIWFFSLSLTITFIILSTIMSFLVNRVFYTYKSNVAQRDHQLAEQSKLVALGEMIGNIAHQWRQPLSVISTAATGLKLQKEMDVLTDEQFVQTCDSINENAQYLSTTIDDFKNFIKGERNKTNFNLFEAINKFLHLLEGSIINNNIVVIKNIDQTIQMNGYQNELIQCLINIFNNSKDALKEIDEKRYFFIDLIKNDDSVTLILKDNAGGIDESIIDKIFEPYFTTKHQSQGTGLGLSMTYNLIVNGMNGNIKATNVEYNYENKQHKGAEFIIELPIQ